MQPSDYIKTAPWPQVIFAASRPVKCRCYTIIYGLVHEVVALQSCISDVLGDRQDKDAGGSACKASH